MLQYLQNRHHGEYSASVEDKMVGFIECFHENKRSGQAVGHLDGTTNDERNRFLLEMTTQCILALERAQTPKSGALMDRVKAV